MNSPDLLPVVRNRRQEPGHYRLLVLGVIFDRRPSFQRCPFVTQPERSAGLHFKQITTKRLYESKRGTPETSNPHRRSR